MNTPADLDARGAHLTVACVATCAPRQCGIATYSADLGLAMCREDSDVTLRYAAIDDGQPAGYGPEVRWTVRQGHAADYGRLADDLNRADVNVVLVQHEFGLYGAWGDPFDDHLTGFLDRVRAPVVTVLHSIPPHPSPSVRKAVQAIGRRSAAVIVMAQLARRILVERYRIPDHVIRVILHGVPEAPVLDRAAVRRRMGVEGRRLVSTFGFLDPHKGIEFMIDAMSTVVAREPDALYMVVGRTHPELAARAGEGYRHELERLVAARGLDGQVRFVDAFVPLERIVELLAASDVYVTPYLDADQMTSGTLAYALGLGRAVVSTPYLHATEALAHGRGLLVPPRDADALAAAVLQLLGEPELLASVERRARAYGAEMAWPLVGARTLAVLRAAAADGSAPAADRASTPPSAAVELV